MATERILNLEELKSSPQWYIDIDDDWLNKNTGPFIRKDMVNKSVQWCKDQAYTVTPDMIAPQQTNENKPTKMRMVDCINKTYIDSNQEQERGLEELRIGIEALHNKTAIARNGTKLEVGKKYKLRTYFEGNFVEIIAIGEKEFFFKSQDGVESINSIKQNWIPYTEEQPAIFNTEDMLKFASWAVNQYRLPTDKVNLHEKALELYLKENHES